MSSDEANSKENPDKERDSIKDKVADFVDLKDLEVSENPLEKQVIIFQGQKEKVSLAYLTGITSWTSYACYLSQNRFYNKEEIIDVIKILLNSDEVEIGSRPLGTSSLDGAYFTLLEEIDVETLANKLISEKFDNSDYNDIYIVSGINESNRNEKIDKLTEYLKITNNKENIDRYLGPIGSDSKIQIVDDQFNDGDFKNICHDHPEKRIYWIYVEDEGNRLILQQIYNPDFYLKRDYKQMDIDIKKVNDMITNEDLPEIVIFYCKTDPRKLTKTLTDSDSRKLNQIKNYCESGKVFTADEDAKATFKDFCKKNQTVHLLKFEEDYRFVWYNSQGSINNLRTYINKLEREIFSLEEDDLIKEIEGRKVLIIADNPGMGKTSTLTKLYETKYGTHSLIETHWVIKINLKDHVQAVNDIKLVNGRTDLDSVVTFLSNIDVKLNNNLAKSVLSVALDKSKDFAKPLLLAFDGFDKVLDEDNRNKIISLLKFLREETAAKLWITTRPDYKEILENTLLTIAVEFNPMDYDAKFAYVKKYLKDRLHLILNEETFAEIFAYNEKLPESESQKYRDEILNKKSKHFRRIIGETPMRCYFREEIEENKRIQKYIKGFLNKIKSVFGCEENRIDSSMDMSKFIGTPLKLHLLLDGSVKDFKNWIEKEGEEDPSFNYLGDVNEVYQRFILYDKDLK